MLQVFQYCCLIFEAEMVNNFSRVLSPRETLFFDVSFVTGKGGGVDSWHKCMYKIKVKSEAAPCIIQFMMSKKQWRPYLSFIVICYLQWAVANSLFACNWSNYFFWGGASMSLNKEIVCLVFQFPLLLLLLFVCGIFTHFYNLLLYNIILKYFIFRHSADDLSSRGHLYCLNFSFYLPGVYFIFLFRNSHITSLIPHSIFQTHPLHFQWPF